MKTIRALTIFQPFAALIVTPSSELPVGQVSKRIENRRWRTEYRGPLLIHAGLSTEWLSEWPVNEFPIVRGAILGIAELLDCVLIEQAKGKPVVSLAIANRWPWLLTHPHAEGPWGFVLGNVRRFRDPVPYSGAQQIWNVPSDNLLVSQAIATAEPIADPFAAPVNHRERLLSMTDADFHRVMAEQFPTDHFLHGVYRTKGRDAVLTFLITKLSRQPEAAR